MKKKIAALLFILVTVTACSNQLASEQESFSDKGISYTFQLPSTWEKEKDYKATYGEGATFGAKDKKSNSMMFIRIYRKETMDLKDFGNKTQKQLSETYNYKKIDDVYMKEFKVNDHSAYKYTVFTKFKEKDVWAHLYYIETNTGFVQLVFYSANDSGYKNRSKIIEESVLTLVETKAEATYDEVTETKDVNTNSNSVHVKNEEVTFAIKGFSKIEGNNGEPLLVVRYDMTNLRDVNRQVNFLKEVAKVTQNDQVLIEADVPVKEKDSALDLLNQHQGDKVAKGQTVETNLIYTLSKTTGEVIMTFSEAFPNQEPVILDLGLLK